MEPITLLILLICVTIGGLLVGVGVHFVPVGGAPAAMAQATGIGTGTTMLAFASGALGLISAGFTVHDMSASNGALHSAYPGFATAIANQTLFTTSGISDNLMAIILVMAAGIVGAMLMMVILAVMANVIYAFAIAVPLVSAKVKFDPITGDRQDIYVTKGTEGHGTPTVAVISSLIGGLFGGLGGALLYLALISKRVHSPDGSFRCDRHIPGELGPCLVQHHGNDRRVPRPQVQEDTKGDHRLRSSFLCARDLGNRNNLPGGVNNV